MLSKGRVVRVYSQLLGAAIKAKVAYPADVVVMLITMLLGQSAGYLALWLFYRSVGTLGGWTLPEATCLYATLFVTEGFLGIACDGLTNLSWIKHCGELDPVLVRPFPAILQIATSTVSLHGIVSIGTGITLLTYAVQQLPQIGPLQFACGVPLLICGFAIRLGVHISVISAAFWTEMPDNPLQSLMHGGVQLVRYPLSMYGKWVYCLLLPFACINYFPLAAMFGKTAFVRTVLVMPILAIVALLSARSLFVSGVNRYTTRGT